MKRFRKAFIPATRLGVVLYVVSLSAWIITGVIAALGGIDWPVATFLSIALTIPTLVYDTIVENADDD